MKTSPKIIAIDGIDNTGKTSLVKRIQKEVNSKSCFFPNPELLDSNEFKRICKNPSYGEKINWIDKLTSVEGREISLLLKDTDLPLLVDRFWFSTLIYQGGSVYPFKSKEDTEIEEYINAKYTSMMENLNVGPDEIRHVLLYYPIRLSFDKDTDIKSQFDKQHKKYIYKMENAINFARTSKSPYLKYTNFSENILKVNYEGNSENGDATLDSIQEVRKNFILNCCFHHFTA